MGHCRILLLLLAVGICSLISHASDCRDKETKECPGWKKSGFCKQSSQWYGYMKENCKKTCGHCPVAAECKDSNKECSSWASRNECKKNPVFMNKNCRKSCGICKSHFSAAQECKDDNKECSIWASTNECKKNPVYMNKNCRKSCGICKSAVTEECKDKNKECSIWASKNECKKNADWMAINCRKSCGICGCKDKFDPEKCQGWANKGECEKNKKWMNENCQQSCKACGGSTSTSTEKKEEKKTVEKNTGTTSINDVYCGLRLKLRVVGGEDAKLGEWPWQIAIAKKITPKTMFCGGSLINKQWVVTASHCFGSPNSNRIKPSDIVIRIGDHNLKKDEGIETVSNVVKIIRHQGYGYGGYDNDITLIKLEKPIKYNQNVKPVCLPAPKADEKPEQMCFVTGWGRLAEFGKVAEILQEAKIPIVKKETCKATLGAISEYTSNMICAGYKKGGIDACEGDSGGPLVCNNGGRFELVGVVSWGQGCARANSYGVYTKVSNYIDWIKKNIQQ